MLAQAQAANEHQLEEAVRQILRKRDHKTLMGNKRLVHSIGEYINGFGGVRKFEQAQEKSEYERNKFNAFLASTIAISQQNNNSPSTRSVSSMSRSTADLTTTLVTSNRTRNDSIRRLDDG